ncbi:MAG: hypothetical protein ACFFDN_22455 [Candidatus Hodarchaeota archaeon]
MARKTKILILLFLIIFSLICVSILLPEKERKINKTESLNYVYNEPRISDAQIHNYTGSYVGNASIMGIWRNSLFDMWFNDNSSTYLVDPNFTLGEYRYNLNYMDIRALNLINGTDQMIVAENLTRQINVTRSFRIAQEFVSPDFITINQLDIYLNYSVPLKFNEYLYLQLYIYDENFQEELDFAERWESREKVEEWYTFFFFSNVLEANHKYNLVFNVIYFGDSGGVKKDLKTDWWKAENYTAPTEDKGKTRVYNGSDWNIIKNDTTRDMLCKFIYDKLIHPSKVGLTFVIDNNPIIPIYRKAGAMGMGRGYEGFLRYYFNTPPTHKINVTVVTNQTLPQLEVFIEEYYVYLLRATGKYDTSQNKIEWTISYFYKDIGVFGPDLFFLFENDWDFVRFYDPNGIDVSDIYFGPLKLYNVSYYGLFQLFGFGFERGNYTGIYTSPNYCNGISTKIKYNNTFEERLSFNLGQTIRIDAEIRNSNNEPISGGSGQIILKNPSGAVIYNQSGLSSLDGIMNSSEIPLTTDLDVGIYSIDIFWSNGKEVAYLSTQIEVRTSAPGLTTKSSDGDSKKTEGLTLETLILIGIIVALAILSTPIALTARKIIRQRNWEKSLRNLFVISKEGLSLYEYMFGVEYQDPELISGMISAIISFVKEATGSKKLLRTIDQEDKKVILYHGQFCTSALLSEKDLPIIHKRIEKFTDAFEARYRKKILHWKGDARIFKNSDEIVAKFFPVDVKEKIVHETRQRLMDFHEMLKSTTDPRQTISIMQKIIQFATQYQDIINTHYLKFFNELIKIAEEKISQ